MRRTEFVTARLLLEERQALDSIADRERLSLSAATRLAIREFARAAGLWPPDQQKKSQGGEQKG